MTQNEGQTCDDGNACTSGDRCLHGECIPASELECDDGDVCSTDHCDIELGCQHEPRDCDDGLECTYDGCLMDYGCAHVIKEGFVLAEGECRTEDEIDPGPCMEIRQGFLLDLPDDTPCDDSNPCTLNTLCQAGVCNGGQPNQCVDGNPRTTDTCSPESGCRHDMVCDEFQVNLASEGHQESIRAVSFAGGGGVAIWRTRFGLYESARISFRVFHADGVPADEEVEVLRSTKVADLVSAARVGTDRFVVVWHWGMYDKWFYRIYDRYGSAVTDELTLPDPLLPEPLQGDEVRMSKIYTSDAQRGFLVMMNNSTNPLGSNRGIYLYRFDNEGHLQVGPVEIDRFGNYDQQMISARPDGVFQIFFGGVGAFYVRNFDSTTLLPVADPVTVTSVTSNPHPFSAVRQTPWGSVVAASNGYHGSWLYWLDPEGNLETRTTLAVTSGEVSRFRVDLAAWSDGRVFALVARNDTLPNGMSLHRFTERNEQIPGIFSIDCSRANNIATPKLIRLSDTRALAVWESNVTDGDVGSIRGRFVSW